MKLIGAIVSLVVFLFVSSMSKAEMYTWTDKDGNVHFSDQQPQGQASKQMSMPARKQSWRDEAADLLARRARAKTREEREVIERQYQQLMDTLSKCQSGEGKACADLKALSQSAQSFTPTEALPESLASAAQSTKGESNDVGMPKNRKPSSRQR
jgi:Flp pilus assembly CpaE family ATPase